MPCSSEHMEPTAREREMKRVATLLVKLWNLIEFPVPPDLQAQADHVYGEGPFFSDVDQGTALLCSQCEEWEDAIRAGCAELKRDALAIGQWWADHKEWDKRHRVSESLQHSGAVS